MSYCFKFILAFDQSHLIDSLNTIGTDYYGMSNIPNDISEEELIILHQANIIAVRPNLCRGASENMSHIITLPNKVWELLGWH